MGFVERQERVMCWYYTELVFYLQEEKKEQAATG